MAAPGGCAATAAAPSAAAAVRARLICFTGGLYAARNVPVSPILRYDGHSPGHRSMRMRRPPFSLLAMALALSAGALVHAADDLVLSRFSDYLDALRVQAGIPGLAAAIVGPDRRDVGRRVRPAGRRPQHRDAALTRRFSSTARPRRSSRRWRSGARRTAGCRSTISVSKFAPTAPTPAATHPAAADAHHGRPERPHLLAIVPSGSRRWRPRSPAAPTRRSAGAVGALLEQHGDGRLGAGRRRRSADGAGRGVHRVRACSATRTSSARWPRRTRSTRAAARRRPRTSRNASRRRRA